TVVSDSALSKAVARLRKALGDDSAHPRFVETVHSLGYRFIADVQASTKPGVTAVRPGGKRGGLYIVAGVAAFAVLVAILFALTRTDPPSRQPDALQTTPVRSLAVLPFANLGSDTGQDYFVEGLHDVLITNLSKINGLKVISRQSTMRYRSSKKTLPEIARELKVDALVEGGVLLIGRQVKVNAQLIHGHSDEHLWAQTYDRDLGDVMALLGEIARTISDEIEVSMNAQDAMRLAIADALDPAANDAYLRGLYYLNRFAVDNFKTSLSYFEQAVEIDPGFVLGWTGVAAANLMIAYFGDEPPRETLAQARVATVKALELDAGHFASHAAIGWVRLFNWDWPGAGEAFETALRLNPNDPMTLHGYADYLMLTGRMEDSLDQVRHARAINPFSPAASIPVPVHLFIMRRYDDSLREIEALLERNPRYPVHWLLAMVLWQTGELDESLAAFRTNLSVTGDDKLLAVLDAANAESGPSNAMRSVAEEMARRASSQYVDPFKIASTFSQAGEIDLALEWLERAVEHGSLELMYVGVRPDFDPLRQDPRFEELMRRMGYPTRQ
ncbi:MAG: tetratricopeptide repeat protein, partial [Gammaproteobacteria bacterium]|nr:tetratricopeptide repeat protein [Gammaproteobacteria bacterium]